MHIDKNDLGLDFFQELVGNSKGIVIRRHEDATLEIDDCIGNVSLSSLVNSPARHVRRIICRTQDSARHAVLIAIGHLEIINDFALVPNVIAGADYVDAYLEYIFRQPMCYAKATRSV